MGKYGYYQWVNHRCEHREDCGLKDDELGDDSRHRHLNIYTRGRARDRCGSYGRDRGEAQELLLYIALGKQVVGQRL